MKFPIRITFVTSQDYQTRQLITEEGNLIGLIHTCNYVHTHTGNTRQPEPQLKSSSCSFAIPSHNSRDVISSQHSRITTCLTAIPSHNSRDMFRATTQGTLEGRPLRYPRSLVDRAHQNEQNMILLRQYCLALLMKHQTLSTSRPSGGVMSSNFCPH